MTNEQLAIMLSELHQKLDGALTEVKENLPPEFRKTTKTFIGTTYTSIPILSKMQSAVDDLNEQVKLLLTQGA